MLPKPGGDCEHLRCDHSQKRLFHKLPKTLPNDMTCPFEVSALGAQ